jgi:transposase-like protein
MPRGRNTPTSITLEECMNQNNGNKQKRRLSAEEKWQIHRECEQPGAKVGEILRKYGLYSSDLQNIRKMVKEGSLERLRQSRPGRKKVTTVSVKDYEELESELTRKEKALAEMTVMFTTLKKKVNLE